MRRILLNDRIIGLSKDYSKNLFKTRNNGRGRKFITPKEGLTKLEQKLRNVKKNVKYADYVKKIIDNYTILNCIKPQYFNSLHHRYFDSLSETELSTNIKINKVTKKFHEWVVEAMRYDAVRDKEFLPYVNKLGIKSCIYCNAQFAITTVNIEEELSGKYELDHFYAKSKYPYLSTSFFNLQPCCSHCNKTKNDKPSLFNLYTNDYKKLELFSFYLEKKSMIKYMLSHNEVDLKIVFECISSELKDNHEELFHISELYEQHKDVVEEIIWKAKIYNKSYKETLSKSFSNFFPNTNGLNRFILGNYDNSNEIHKRPLAKLVQDVARQLEIIKK